MIRAVLLLTVAAALLVAATARLAVWQFERAAQKRALEHAAAAAQSSAAVTVRAPQAIAPFMRAALVGHYLPDADILLENRLHARRHGYHVITPFALADDGAALINRGWLAGGDRRPPAAPPPAAGRVTVQGVFYPDNAGAYRLSDLPETGRVRQNLIIGEVAAQSGLALLSLALIRAADSPDVTTTAASPLAPVSVRLNYKSAQSVSYAWQWLSFCALTVVFYFILLRRLHRSSSANV